MPLRLFRRNRGGSRDAASPPRSGDAGAASGSLGGGGSEEAVQATHAHAGGWPHGAAGHASGFQQPSGSVATTTGSSGARGLPPEADEVASRPGAVAPEPAPHYSPHQQLWRHALTPAEAALPPALLQRRMAGLGEHGCVGGSKPIFPFCFRSGFSLRDVPHACPVSCAHYRRRVLLFPPCCPEARLPPLSSLFPPF